MWNGIGYDLNDTGIWIDGARTFLSTPDVDYKQMHDDMLGKLSEKELEEYFEDKERKVLDREKEKDEETFSPEQKKINNLISGQSSNVIIKNRILKYLYNAKLEENINKYAEKEGLTSVFIDMAKQKEGLLIVLKNFFIQDCNYIPSNSLVNTLKEFCAYIYKNEKNRIIYDRVSVVQKFIHNKVQEISGRDKHLNLDKCKMKNVLSAVRLHLEIYDFRYKDIDKLLKQNLVTYEKANIEYNNPARPNLLPNQKYVPLWRVKGDHLSPLFSSLGNATKKIKLINKIDVFLPEVEYKIKVLTIFK